MGLRPIAVERLDLAELRQSRGQGLSLRRGHAVARCLRQQASGLDPDHANGILE